MEVFRLQDFPVELERSILEIAARMELQTALNLSLVCRQFKEWIQPLVYEMVTLGHEDIALFLRTMEMFPADFFTRCVRKLCLTVSISARDARTILQTCTGVSSLACWVDFIGTQPFVSFHQLFHQLPLRRLSIEAAHFRSLELSECTWIHSLTFLDLIFWGEDSLQISELHSLPALTHLALSLPLHPNVEDSSLAYVLSAAPVLQILVLLVEDDELDRFEHTTRLDPRIVCMHHPEAVPDWEAPYRGRSDIWSHAERIVAERRVAVN